jgi:uncharacterized UPF0160 family protein
MEVPMTTVVTHDGCFHADDVFAVATLQMALGEFTVVRTRHPDVIERADIVVDVGAVYDATKNRFDHHQKDRAGARENGILYSSFGLVWKAYGHRVCEFPLIQEIVDRVLVQPIDATDNGQVLFQGGTPCFKGVDSYSLSSAVSTFNPCWHEMKGYDLAFSKAVQFARRIIEREIASAAGSVLAEVEVANAIQDAHGGPLIELPQFMPWGDQVRDRAPNALFVIFPSETETWMVQAVNAKPGTFESRKLLPALWAGLRDQAFQEVTEVADAVFCHPGRFICGARSRIGAQKLAHQAILAK